MTDMFEDLRWREKYRHHPGLGRVGVSMGEGKRIVLALDTTLRNIRDIATIRDIAAHIPVNVRPRSARSPAAAKR